MSKKKPQHAPGSIVEEGTADAVEFQILAPDEEGAAWPWRVLDDQRETLHEDLAATKDAARQAAVTFAYRNRGIGPFRLTEIEDAGGTRVEIVDRRTGEVVDDGRPLCLFSAKAWESSQKIARARVAAEAASAKPPADLDAIAQGIAAKVDAAKASATLERMAKALDPQSPKALEELDNAAAEEATTDVEDEATPAGVVEAEPVGVFESTPPPTSAEVTNEIFEILARRKEAIAELRIAERHERVAKEHRREAEARVAELNGELDDAYARRTTGRQARLIFEPITSDAPAGGPVTKPAASAPDDARLTPPKVEEVAWAYNGRTWAIRVKQINPERFLALIPDLATDIEGTGSTAADAIADVQTKASIRLDDVDPGKKPGKKRAKKTGAKKTSSGRGRGRKSVDAVVVEG